MSRWTEILEFKHIPEQYRSVAELIGVQQLLALSEEYGGSNLYIPKSEALIRTARDELIKKEYNGYNAEELAKVYGLTERWVQEICRDAPAPGQMSIFDDHLIQTGTG